MLPTEISSSCYFKFTSQYYPTHQYLSILKRQFLTIPLQTQNSAIFSSALIGTSNSIIV